MNAAAAPLELVDSSGAGPFITRRVFRRAEDGAQFVWQSRNHRKRPRRPERHARGSASARVLHALWMPDEPNWWIGIGFAIGAWLFFLASLASLAPKAALTLGIATGAVNPIYFAGSIFFTAAAFLQLHQAANAGPGPAATVRIQRKAVVGWRPSEAGWLSCMLQFAGTLLFNVSTFDDMIGGFDWFHEDLAVWIPDMFGSVLFLASGYLALIEVCHRFWAWKPDSLSWWIATINFIGCAAFMVSAIFAFTPPAGTAPAALWLATAGTLLGALAFLFGGLLMLPEGAPAAPPDTPSP